MENKKDGRLFLIILFLFFAIVFYLGGKIGA